MASLFSKKDSGVNLSATPAPSSASGLTIAKLVFVGFLLTALIILATSYATYLLYAKRVDTEHESLLTATAAQSSAALEARIDTLIDRGLHFAEGERFKNKLQLLAPTQIKPSQEWNDEILSMFPYLQRVLIFNPRTQQPDDSVDPALGFAAIDLAGSSRARLELHQPGNIQEQLNLVIPIEGDERALLLGFDPKMLRDWIEWSYIEGSLLELQQQYSGNQPITISTMGDIKLRGPQNFMTEKWIEHAPFKIQVSIVREELTSSQERMIYLSGFGVSLVLLGLVSLILSFGIRKIIQRDLSTLVHQVENFGVVDLRKTYPIKLDEFRDASRRIDLILNRRSSTPDIGDEEIKTAEGVQEVVVKSLSNDSLNESDLDKLMQRSESMDRK